MYVHGFLYIFAMHSLSRLWKTCPFEQALFAVSQHSHQDNSVRAPEKEYARYSLYIRLSSEKSLPWEGPSNNAKKNVTTFLIWERTPDTSASSVPGIRFIRV
jgi:hypothetical protein